MRQNTTCPGATDPIHSVADGLNAWRLEESASHTLMSGKKIFDVRICQLEFPWFLGIEQWKTQAGPVRLLACPFQFAFNGSMQKLLQRCPALGGQGLQVAENVIGQIQS